MLRAFITFNRGILNMGAGVKVWLRILMALNTMSLAIDTVDVVQYLRGDRGTLV